MTDSAHQRIASTTMCRKRLAIFMDGTWEDKQMQTSVWRLFMAMAEVGSDGVPQFRKYFKGVGTNMTDHLTGGLLGSGLADIIRDAYLWLVEFYNDGDDIFIFGFSRGAFEVRSLVGLIGVCGLMSPASPLLVTQLWEHFKRAHLPDSDPHAALNIEQIIKRQASGATLPDIESRRMAESCSQVFIKFVGMFDVVAADPAAKDYKSGQIGRLVGRVCHAMAIDEHRTSFQVDLCLSNDVLEGTRSGLLFDGKEESGSLEQRWFIGCHSNIGGGIIDDELCQIPIKWMHDSARESGLGFRPCSTIKLDGGEHVRGVISNSLTTMYLITQLYQPHYRPIGSKFSINETIDTTVFERIQAMPEYRPKNIMDWAVARGVDVLSIKPAVIATDTARPVASFVVSSVEIDPKLEDEQASKRKLNNISNNYFVTPVAFPH